MNVLRASLKSNSSTSYLVSDSSIPLKSHIITPQQEVPEPFPEPDWKALLEIDPTQLELGELKQAVRELQRGLHMARDCVRAREAVVESAHATNVILELTCQCQRAALYQKEAKKQEKVDKRTIFGDGKPRVVTDDDFIAVIEEIDQKSKEMEEEKEERKRTRAKAKESKAAEKVAWQEALERWSEERQTWVEERDRLKDAGYRAKDLPKAPKKPRKADVLLAVHNGSDRNSAEGESDAEDEAAGEDGGDNEGEDEENGEDEEGTEEEDNDDDDEDCVDGEGENSD